MKSGQFFCSCKGLQLEDIWTLVNGMLIILLPRSSSSGSVYALCFICLVLDQDLLLLASSRVF